MTTDTELITDEELIDNGVPAINRRVNIWRLTEAEEAEYIRSGLKAIVPHIPQIVRPVLLDGADGLDDDEVTRHAERTLDDATAAAVGNMPAWIASIAAPIVRTQLRPFVRAVFECAQMGFALGLEKNTI